jgi:hypothetical protein
VQQVVAVKKVPQVVGQLPLSGVWYIRFCAFLKMSIVRALKDQGFPRVETKPRLHLLVYSGKHSKIAVSKFISIETNIPSAQTDSSSKQRE